MYGGKPRGRGECGTKMRKHTDTIRKLEGELETLVRGKLPKPYPESSPLFIIPFQCRINEEATRQWKLMQRRGVWSMLSKPEEIDFILDKTKATGEQRDWLWDNLPLKKNKKEFQWKKSPWKLIDNVMKCLDDLIQKRWNKLVEEGWTNYDYDISDMREVEEFQIKYRLLDTKLSEGEMGEWGRYLDKHHVLDLELGNVHYEIMGLYSDIERLRKDDMTLGEFIEYTTEGKKDSTTKKKPKTIYQVVGGRTKKDPSTIIEMGKITRDETNNQIIKGIYERESDGGEPQTISEYYKEIQREFTDGHNRQIPAIIKYQEECDKIAIEAGIILKPRHNLDINLDIA